MKISCSPQRELSRTQSRRGHGIGAAQQLVGLGLQRSKHVNDDNGHKAVFTEHGASTCQVAATTLLDTIARLSTRQEKPNDASSAHTHVHMSKARVMRLPEKERKRVLEKERTQLKKQWCLLNETLRSPCGKTVLGKKIGRSTFET